tara:strand:+ start:568 stop:3297 length:2730 start_codon:yes stop_codon:yes gene_type:complete
MTDSHSLPPLINAALFHSALTSKATIIVPNQRLAKHISHAWGRQVLPQKRVWEAPSVYSMDTWIKSCWDQIQDLHLPEFSGLAVVGRAQSQYYWQRAIDSCDEDLGLRYAGLAETTFDTLTLWGLRFEQIPGDDNGAKQFKTWCAAYLKLLQKNALITRAQSCHPIAKTFISADSRPLSAIYIYGFQSIPPMQQRLLDAATQQLKALDLSPLDSDIGQPSDGAQRETLNDGNGLRLLPRARQVACVDSAQEIHMASRWAADELKRNPMQRIAIVVPDLNQRIAELERALDSALADATVATPVNFSAGIPLANTPLISAAFDLFGFLDYRQPLSFWLRLLYSPYSALDNTPLQVRGEAEKRLRKTSQFEFRASQFLECFEPADETAEGLKAFVDIARNNRRAGAIRRNFSAWADYFQDYLETLEWPGARSLNSLEYQQQRQWTLLLEKYAELDNLDIEVGLPRAVQMLKSMALEHPFHRQTPDAPLQVLGLLEASGLQFDNLWIVGLEQKRFPSLVDINPLLPSDFQRIHRMPHSLPERELEIALNLLHGFHQNSQNLILSYPQSRGEETLEASPLLRQAVYLEDPVKTHLQQPGNTPYQPTDSDQCELYMQSPVPFDPTREPVRGGATLINNQAICPLNAFAIHRLKMVRPELPHQGLSNLQRGNLLHQIMFLLWDSWRSSRYLHDTSEQLLEQQLEQIIADVIDTQSRHIPCLRGDRYRLLERRRLHKLISRWLDVERQREPFEVLALEHSTTVQLGTLTLSLTLDRIDQIGDKRLIIDYKSGAVSSGGWHAQRLFDAQLPLYVVAAQPTVNGCAFAQLKGAEVRFLGEAEGLLTDALRDSHDWSAQVDLWRASLHALAEEFCHGRADLQVYHPSGFAQQAYLLPFNRWSEQTELAALTQSEASHDDH